MKITRLIGSLNGTYREPGRIIDRDTLVDQIVVQEESCVYSFAEEKKGLLCQKEWQLQEKDIYRYSIEGKANVVTRRTVDGERTFVENAKDIPVGSAYEGKIVFSISSEEVIMGLGQHEEGIINYRNCRQYLYQNNMQIPMPVFLSSNNYGVLLDAGCLIVYEENNNEITITLDAVSQIDYYVIEGENLMEVVKGIRSLTGKAAMLPLWAYGYIQSKERYKTQEEIIQIANEFEQRNIPVSCLVLDWLSWEEGKWGNKRLDKKRFPDLLEMTDSLNEKGIAFMVSIWPNMNNGCEDNQEMLEAEKMYANLSTYDAFDEEARKLYWKQCDRELFPGGTDAWWCDSTEPFTPDWGGSEKKSNEERYELSKEQLTKYMDAREANTYALMHAKGIHDNQRRADDSKRVVNLTRSGYPSIQKYGAVLWSGDIMATWEVFRHQIVEGLQMSSSGVPYWTLDIGAFFTGSLNTWKKWSGAVEGTQPWFWNGDFEDGVKDKGYCELYVRWLQYGCFLPIMRSHGTDTPREPWNFGDKGSVYYDTIIKYIRLRYRLIPYIYSLAYQVYQEDSLMMRSLLFDYPQDKKAASITDEYMFGDFLVCPITEPMEYAPSNQWIGKKNEWEIYLPKGDDWFDYDSKVLLNGGSRYTVSAPINKMPLYIRCGSIIPIHLKEENLYQVQNPEIIGLEIYGGKDGSFLYYLDKGNGYEYQKGEYLQIRLTWKEEEQTLHFSEVIGSYSFPIKWMITYYNIRGKSYTTQITYNGTLRQVKL